ncbi:hypothetical protein ACFVAQ_19655 [Streptomyces sp. NPDC057651]|uniref:hypothetical protein n=1 Tax=unclassified Streptomyces TaxID=2593676 RepID=UPI00369747EE
MKREVDIQLRLIRLGLDTELVRGVLAEPVDVLEHALLDLWADQFIKGVSTDGLKASDHPRRRGADAVAHVVQGDPGGPSPQAQGRLDGE